MPKLTKSQRRQLKALDRNLKDLRVKAFIHAGSTKKTFDKIIADQDKVKKKLTKLIAKADLTDIKKVYGKHISSRQKYLRKK